MNKCSFVFVSSMLLSVAVARGMDDSNSRSSSSSSSSTDTIESMFEQPKVDLFSLLVKASGFNKCNIEPGDKFVTIFFTDRNDQKKGMHISPNYISVWNCNGSNYSTRCCYLPESYNVTILHARSCPNIQTLHEALKN